MHRFLVVAPALLAALAAGAQPESVAPGWRAVRGGEAGLEPPNSGTQQTSATVFDIDGDRVNDFVITERTAAPAVVGYLRKSAGWRRIVIDAGRALVEAGAACEDVDSDGDLDFVAGGDGRSNEVWWWENPGAASGYDKPWSRRTIKSSGPNKHHDLMFLDVDGDNVRELIFWNQGGRRLLLARRPARPRDASPGGGGEWPMETVFEYSSDSEMLQRGKPAAFRSVNEHEGLWAADIDLDGRQDIVGGGYWFKRTPQGRFIPNLVDASYHFSRSAAGQLTRGGRPEVVLAVGDGTGPLIWYEWVKGTWMPHILAEVDNGHSLAVLDFDGDGNADIFLAEMRLNGGNPASRCSVFLGDGAGNFRETVLAAGFDNHESKAADLDGDGDLDILMKPYNHLTPSLNILINEGGPPRAR
jgi:hypothetical protein